MIWLSPACVPAFATTSSMALQAVVRNRRSWLCARSHFGWRRVRMQASQHSVLPYHGRQPGFRSSNIAAHAQVGGATPAAPKPEETKDQFCRMCGTKMQLAVPKGEAAWRHVCSSCGYIDYFNPKMVRMLLLPYSCTFLACILYPVMHYTELKYQMLSDAVLSCIPPA